MNKKTKYCYDYARAAITVDIILINKNKILLIKRGNDPYKNQWALPGGFMDMDETLEHAAIRELEEETCIKVDKLSQFKTYSTINRDPRHRTISTVFYNSADSNLRNYDAIAKDDAIDAIWWDTNKLPELAFDHGEIISEFLKIKKAK